MSVLNSPVSYNLLCVSTVILSQFRCMVRQIILPSSGEFSVCRDTPTENQLSKVMAGIPSSDFKGDRMLF